MGAVDVARKRDDGRSRKSIAERDGCQRLKTQRRLATMRRAARSLGNRAAVDLAQQLSPPRPYGRAASERLLSVIRRAFRFRLASCRGEARPGTGLAIEPQMKPPVRVRGAARAHASGR